MDEAFLDVTGSQRLLGGPEFDRRGNPAPDSRAPPALTASVGIAPNKLLAKIASDLNKPDGMCRIGPENMREVLDALPIQKLFGVGQRSLPAVQAAGIRTFGDLRRASEEMLWRAFGKHGKAMQATGDWESMIAPSCPIAKENRSARRTPSPTDIRDAAQLGRQLSGLADRAAARLRAHQLAAGRVTVKIRRDDFTTYTRQQLLEPPTQDTAVVAATAQAPAAGLAAHAAECGSAVAGRGRRRSAVAAPSRSVFIRGAEGVSARRHH